MKCQCPSPHYLPNNKNLKCTQEATTNTLSSFGYKTKTKQYPVCDDCKEYLEEYEEQKYVTT